MANECHVFCFGFPKSGTTFLQMLLDAHPSISCPSEHQFNYFIDRIPDLLTKYNQILAEADRRTGRQGAAYFRNWDAEEILRSIIMTALHRGARGKSAKWIAVKDNGIVKRLPFYAALFPNAKFLCVVRDPRDVAISSWHHNIRVESDFLSRAKDFPTWSISIAKSWGAAMGNLISLNSQLSPRLHFIKYEDLLREPNSSLQEMLNFLGAKSDQQVLRRCVQAVSFSKLAQATTTGERNEFFRRGLAEDWKKHMDPETSDAIKNIASAPMAHFGYA